MNVNPTSGLRRNRVLVVVGVLVFSLVFLLTQRQLLKAPSDDVLLSKARTALERRQLELATDFASQISRESSLWSQSRLIAGEAASRLENFDESIAYYREIEKSDTELSILGEYSSAEVYRHIGELSNAIEAYQSVVERDPDHHNAHQKLAILLELAGLRWEAIPHFVHLIKTETASLNDLVLLGDLERHIEQIDYLQQCKKRAPDDPLVSLGLATYFVKVDGDTTIARQILQDLVEDDPDLVAAQALLGELLVDAERDVFLQWHSQLPDNADESPDIWFTRGLWMRRQGHLKVAARCFWETVRMQPEHRRGNYNLGQVLVALDEPGGHEFSERSLIYFNLTKILDEVLLTDGQNESAVRKACELLEECGRLLEAQAWARIASQNFPQASWPEIALRRILPKLELEGTRTISSANLVAKYDYSGLPDYRNGLRNEVVPRDSPAEVHDSQNLIRFTESNDVGLDFQYYNAEDLATPGVRVLEQTGGGVAALDFDLDRWPDLYLTQGCEWKTGERTAQPSGKYFDRIYRNQSGHFFDVTVRAGLKAIGFGQGPTVGDWNNDGFPDLYVANIGQNQLFLNNGDGTFTDVTQEAGLASKEWTASSVIVDLNDDGLPDLFDLNYLSGKGVYTAICGEHACSPSVFDGTADQVALNLGDGRFKIIPNASPEVDAKGLGVVATVIRPGEVPSLFIANDQVPNFFLRPELGDSFADFKLINEGFLTGLGYNESGLAMACMGIAADDADGDNRLDFFVTNFEDEANTLYLQDANGLFVDATNPAGLRAASWPYVGWGTQFLDADLDGLPDLVVGNGHVDDYRDEGGKYKMRPQFFRNTGRARFVELPGKSAGNFFEKEFLSRGLARVDWNRDGRPDFVVSNINDPASLVTNDSSAGHFLNLRLHATQSARDAIGTFVTLTTESTNQTKQLLAGDGYQASNERILQFGLGQIESVDLIEITWPSGATTTIRNPPIDATLELVENRRHATIWKNSTPAPFAIDDNN